MKRLSSYTTTNESLAGRFRSEGVTMLTILECVCVLKWKRRISVEGLRRCSLERRTRKDLLLAGDARARPLQPALLRENALSA